MSIFAKINSENIVENVIICEDKDIGLLDGVYIKEDHAITNKATLNSFYDEIKNKFISPKPYPSWVLNSNSIWESPVGPEPEGFHSWNEDSQEWISLS